MYSRLNKIKVNKTKLNRYDDMIYILNNIIYILKNILDNSIESVNKDRLLDSLTNFILSIKKSNIIDVNFSSIHLSYYNNKELTLYIIEYYLNINNNINHSKYINNIIFNICRIYRIDINEIESIIEYKNNYKRV